LILVTGDKKEMGKIAKRVLAISLVLLFFSAAISGGAYAQPLNPLNGTAHMFEYGSVEPVFSECGSLCHSFLGMEKGYTEAQIEWLEASEAEGLMGAVTALCATCHRSDGAHGATMSSAVSDDNVYHPNSHGQKMALVNPPTSTDINGSGLQKLNTSDGIFECNTCHESHSDAFRPFLVEEITTICAKCHQKRNFVNGVEQSGPSASSGNWGLNKFTGLSNPGSHPVGKDIAGERTDGALVEINCFFRIELAPEPLLWSLGPHLTNGYYGGVTCLTCHAVHGVDLDMDAYGDMVISTPPEPSFLAIPQSEGTVTGYDRPVANGSGGSNILCEACHGLDRNPPTTPQGTSWSDESHNVNPGKLNSFSHPVDSYPSLLDMGVTSFPDGWPEGDSALAGDGVSPTLICETCHTPHPAAAINSGRTDVLIGAGEFILRAPISAKKGEAILCDQCHMSAIDGHHPIERTYNSLGVFYLKSSSANSNDVLTCSTCHNSAHGWNQPGLVGLDPNWVPFDNGRSEIQEEDMFNLDMSKTCMDCHYFMDGDGTSLSPTMGSKQTVIEPHENEYPFYEAADKSMGTHYIGLIHEDDAKWIHQPLLDPFNTTLTWKQQSPDSAYEDGLADGWARFGGKNSKGSRVIVCESCHELEPDKNNGFKHLLLAPYAEGNNGLDEYPGDADGEDILCKACHGLPQGSHPMTGSEVDGRPMNPDDDSLRDQILGYATIDKKEAALSCDSCHQPHDANSNGYSYILDVPETLSFVSGPAIQKGENIPGDSAFLEEGEGYQEFTGNYGTYTSPRTRSPQVQNLCRQCHDK